MAAEGDQKPVVQAPHGEPEKLQEVFETLPREKKAELLTTLVLAKSHQGPLPDPETLEHYARLIPNPLPEGEGTGQQRGT